MKKGDTNYKNGFTIIEVVLVLGIAGLIFLMMMIALPALQRQERDTERREDITFFLDTVKKFQTNNRGALPGLTDNGTDETSEVIVAWSEEGLADAGKSSWRGFYRDSLGEKFKDPNGENYRLDVLRCGGSITNASCGPTAANAARNISNRQFPNDFTLLVIVQSKCSNDAAQGVVASSNARKMAVLYKLEGGGIYCADI